MTEEPFHVDVSVHMQPTEMGIKLDVHHQAYNMTVEFDPSADPIYMQGILASLPEFIIHAMDRITSDDSPVTAREWWEQGIDRLGEIRAEHIHREDL